jgi:hypothetical protein
MAKAMLEEAGEMDFSNVNYVAVMLAAAASFIFGGVWYGIFSKQWMAAAGSASRRPDVLDAAFAARSARDFNATPSSR